MKLTFINNPQSTPHQGFNSSPLGAGGPQAIILAGGLGTRLRTVVSELPKCMAPVNGKPFIEFVIDYLQQQGIRKFIFALGYKSESFQSYLQSKLAGDDYQLSIEQEPLGTGGAIRLACEKASGQTVFVVNGDTLFKTNLKKLSEFHQAHNADCTLSLKPMQNFDRYGVVTLNEDNSIHAFREKKSYASGLINGGVYAINVPAFLNEDLGDKFSFEKDYLEQFYTKRKIFGLIQNEYFIDIGIPEDYEKAQQDLLP